ncbi:MAG: glycosyltransferase [Synergistaceae bacterium]|jgi:processive 1,2-diacylglycerol beta-glucosyltransferase|nr:glycosyltransferase [Synergistaceae bacterium]
MPDEELRLLIFHASVGTGHIAAAEALGEWCGALRPGSEIMKKDLLRYAPKWLARSVRSSYLAMARRYPWIWERLYKDTDVRSGVAARFWNGLGRGVSRACLKKLMAEVKTFKPNVVLTTHFFGMSALLDVWEHSIPIYFVATDYATHLLQRDPRFDGWFVGSEEASRQFRADNVPSCDATVKNFGIPVSRSYSEPPDRGKSRKKLSVGDGEVLVSITGGGIGAGAMDVIADSMLDRKDWRVEILCGANRSMYETLRDKYYPFKNVNVCSYVNNMQDYYAASDMVVLKPGGLSAAEATACGAAILLMDPLPGVERYNCEYLLEHGAARKIYEIRRTGEQVEELIASPLEIQRMRENAKALGKRNAARDIINWLIESLNEGMNVV